jgi:hypothetical protein
MYFTQQATRCRMRSWKNHGRQLSKLHTRFNKKYPVGTLVILKKDFVGPAINPG